MAAVGNVYYTFVPQKLSSGNVSDYTKTGDQTVDEMTWNVPGNWYATGALRIGGKSITDVDRVITGKTAMGDAIAQIVISHTGVTSDNLKLNSITVTAASDDAFTQDVESKTVVANTDFTYAKNTEGTITITPTSGKWAKNAYYKIAFNVTNSNGSNYAFVLNKIEFYSYAEGGATPATTKTIYCKNVQSWWTQDGAAIGVYYWGGTSAAINWPGVRMAPIAGQEGLWSYDVPADITGLIFVRVNGSGDVSDWGAKTADLTLPTDGKNLYTITSTSAVWGDPGVTGEWSVYGDDPTPVDPPTNKFYVTGDSAFIVDAGMTADKKWNPAAIASEKDTLVLNLKAGMAYKMKLTTDGTWNTAKGYADLTAPVAEGLSYDNDGNICFTLSADGPVTIIYKSDLFKLDGGFVVVPPVVPTLANGFYLIGQKGWDAAALDASLKFAANPDNENEYVLTTTLVKDQHLKVVKVENDALVAWYPDGMDNDYIVDDAHAGENKEIYFQETYKADWAEFGGYFWTGAKEIEPEGQMYVWNGIGVTKAEDATEKGGIAEAVQADGTNIAVGVSQKGNWCLKANKGFNSGAYYLGVAMKNGVNAGDTIKIAYFRTTTSNTYVLGMDFSADKESASSTYQILTKGDPQALTSNGTPADSIFIVPEGVENAKYMRIYRNSGSTGLWVAKVEIVKAEGGVTPPPTPTLDNGFYLIGQKGWDAAALDASLKFAANPDNENEYVLTTTLVKDQHLKVVKVENDALVAWYPDGMDNEYVVDAAHAGENKDIYFQETYKADWAEFGGYFWTGSNEPAGCNWDAIEFLGTTDPAYANQFKLCKTGDYPGVVNIQQPGFATEIGIYVTFPSAVFGEISLPASAYDIQGAGIIFHLSAFTAVETEVTVVCESNPIVFTVYNAKGGVTPPPTGVEIRLVPTIWNVDGAKFAAVTWKAGESMESPAAVVSDWFVGGDTVVGYIPAEADSIGFARFAAGTATPSLDMSTIWNHSDKLAIDPSMIYTITAWGKEYSPGYWGEAPQPVEVEWFLAGDMTDWQNSMISFKNGDIKVTLADANRTYAFKIVKVEGENMSWYGNNGTMTREYNQDWVFDSNEQENGKLTADVAGEYTFKMVVDGIGTPHVSVTYPNGTGLDNVKDGNVVEKLLRDGQVVIIRGEHIYTPMGQMIK